MAHHHHHLAACGGPSQSTLYTDSNPARIKGCPDAASDADLVTLSYAAMMKALAERGWRFDHVLPQEGAMAATACTSGGDECVTMIFVVGKDGGISVTRNPNQQVERDMDGHMLGWMSFFEQKFSLYRCMSKDLAIQELERYGAIQ